MISAPDQQTKPEKFARWLLDGSDQGKVKVKTNGREGSIPKRGRRVGEGRQQKWEGIDLGRVARKIR